jgi:hypothetical protein
MKDYWSLFVTAVFLNITEKAVRVAASELIKGVYTF